MNDSTNNSGNTRPRRKWLFPLGVAAIAISSVVVVSCFHDDDPATVATNDTGTTLPSVDEPAPLQVTGTGLACDSPAPLATTDASALMVADITADETTGGIPKHNVSFQVEMGDATNLGSWNNHNAGNTLKRLSAIVPGQTPDGLPAVTDDGPDGISGTADDVLGGDVHPLLVSYGEQVIGEFEYGDGSADVGDPDNIDDIFVSLSMDNGKSWKKFNSVSDTADKSSKSVSWNNLSTTYPGHSMKPTMAIQGNDILVAWNDKYCPSGDPFDLVNDDGTLVDPEQPDLYKVNGAQGTIDYGGIVALPNDKLVYEVPFSCVWTARGEFVLDPEGDGSTMYTIQWRKAQQLTSGTRDSNKIWIAPAEVGFAITWQEDPVGLRPGKGEGPGAGWSGATTNHGADIWYTYIGIDQFDDVCTDVDCATVNEDPAPLDIFNLAEKPKPAVNFTYPVRITNNEVCVEDDSKLYCDPEIVPENCISTVSVTSNSGKVTNRCVHDDLDYMVADSNIDAQAAILDGDTGASRPALKILKTNADPAEYIAILAYEETKGLSESDPADQGTTDTDIALEGKAVYFESFFWDQPVTVSAGRIVNTFVPEVTEINLDGTYTTSDLLIYENARRVVILPQVDPCEAQNAGDPTFAIMYKQGYETQGGPSDMFVRVNYGFTYDDFGLLDNREVTNVSSHNNTDVNGDGEVIWDINTSLDEQSYDNPFDNTFSPRGWLRGSELYTGFEYSPLWRATSVGTVPNNFWIHRYVDSTWQGPMQISIVNNTTGLKVSTLDPRFIPTPKGSATTLTSDESNPDVIFLGYGTFDMESGHELDLFYTRSTDKGATWEYLDANNQRVVGTVLGPDGIPDSGDELGTKLAKLAARSDVVEMELQGAASPDGTMYMGVWNEESEPPVTEGDASRYGLESRFGLVEYDTDVVVAP